MKTFLSIGPFHPKTHFTQRTIFIHRTIGPLVFPPVQKDSKMLEYLYLFL